MLDFHEIVSTGSHDGELCAGFLGRAEDKTPALGPRFEGFVVAILGIHPSKAEQRSGDQSAWTAHFPLKQQSRAFIKFKGRCRASYRCCAPPNQACTRLHACVTPLRPFGTRK
jgi:hypothetical protein